MDFSVKSAVMRRVGYAYDTLCGGHASEDAPHPECPERIYSIDKALRLNGFVDKVVRCGAQWEVNGVEGGILATREQLEVVHGKWYLDKVFKNMGLLEDWFDDIFTNKSTRDSALRATGTALKMVQMIVDGEIDCGFANVRPPGHHASENRCAGFCFFNTVAIAAITAARQGRRVLIVDWDVHYGDGTVAILKTLAEKDPKVAENIFFFSIHRWDNGSFYPGAEPHGKSNSLVMSRVDYANRVINVGFNGESRNDPANRIINVGFNGPKGDEFYIDTFKSLVLPLRETFKPDLIIVSAGFDAAVGDEIGGCHVTPQCYGELTRLLSVITPHVALVLEGGYNLRSISQSAVECMKALFIPF